MPHDAHPMGVLISAMSALSVFHPDANPALRVSTYLALYYVLTYFVKISCFFFFLVLAGSGSVQVKAS